MGTKNYTVVLVSYWDYDGGAVYSTHYVKAGDVDKAIDTATDSSGFLGHDHIDAAFVAEGFVADVSRPMTNAVRLDDDTVMVNGEVYKREG
jgi:hypothetical protein